MALYRHTAMGTFPGEEWSFTLHTTGSGTLTAAQAAWDAAVGSMWTGGLDAIVSSVVSCTETTTASLDPATGKQQSRLSTSTTRAGAAAGETLPAQCACAVSTRTALATRSGRGRFYLPPFEVSVMSSGVLSASAVGTTLAAAQALFASLSGAGLAPVLLNRSSMAQTPITALDVGNVIDTQRRRRNKLIEARQSVVV